VSLLLAFLAAYFEQVRLFDQHADAQAVTKAAAR
jgi:hypothetical protein